MSQTITAAGGAPTARLILLLAVALALRLGWALSRPVDEASLKQLPDQLEYLELGRSLLRGDGLRYLDARFNDYSYAYRMPGYPMLVGGLGGSVRAVRFAQAILDTGTVLGAYLLARRWLSTAGALLTAALVAFNPFLIFFTGLILTETLFASTLAWGMVLIIRAGSSRAVRACWWAGAAVMALSVLVRPSALLLPIGLVACAAIGNRQWIEHRSSWAPPVATTMLILLVVALAPWAWRNHRVLGSWIFTTTSAGATLYDGFNPDATGASDQSRLAVMPQLRTMNEVGRSEYLSQLAWQHIRENPRQTIELAFAKIARTWSPIPLSREFSSRRNVVVAAGYMVPFYLLILAGLTSRGVPPSAKVFLLLPAIYFTMVHALSVGSLRYRVPADVPMAVVAAGGLLRISGAVRAGTGSSAA